MTQWLSDSVTQFISDRMFYPLYSRYIYIYNIYIIYMLTICKQKIDQIGAWNKLSHWVTESLSHFWQLMDILLNLLTGRTLGQKTIFRGTQLNASFFSILRVRIINEVSSWKLLKIGPYRHPKFGGSRKKPYLCTVVQR